MSLPLSQGPPYLSLVGQSQLLYLHLPLPAPGEEDLLQAGSVCAVHDSDGASVRTHPDVLTTDGEACACGPGVVVGHWHLHLCAYVYAYRHYTGL